MRRVNCSLLFSLLILCVALIEATEHRATPWQLTLFRQLYLPRRRHISAMTAGDMVWPHVHTRASRARAHTHIYTHTHILASTLSLDVKVMNELFIIARLKMSKNKRHFARILDEVYQLTRKGFHVVWRMRRWEFPILTSPFTVRHQSCEEPKAQWMCFCLVNSGLKSCKLLHSVTGHSAEERLVVIWVIFMFSILNSVFHSTFLFQLLTAPILFGSIQHIYGHWTQFMIWYTSLSDRLSDKS